jgi:PPOX class probable F420-dependent enzyme
MSRRNLIQMTREEVDAFLAGRHTMGVATIGQTGQPHLVAMWYGFLDGMPAFWTYARSQKVQNLRRDPRITCLVEDGVVYEELRGVELSGKATIVEAPDAVRRVGESISERYVGAIDDAVREAVVQMGKKRVAVRIDVEQIVSWDHRKLGGAY